MGQHELNVRYADVLTMADRHAVYKQCLKELADQQGISITFMAKFSPKVAGSSSHVHLSLWKDGKNLFAGDQALGPVRCSNEFRWFLGGWLKHVPEMMVCYAPTINSYKRYQSGSWAPTRIAWSHDNRTAGFRVVGSGSSLRIESRIHCNPYLVFAAPSLRVLTASKTRSSRLRFLRVMSTKRSICPCVPHTLRDATELFANSAFANQVFGEEVVEHYSELSAPSRNLLIMPSRIGSGGAISNEFEIG